VNLDAALGESQLSAYSSSLCPIQIREKVKEIRGPERCFHNLLLSFTKCVTYCRAVSTRTATAEWAEGHHVQHPVPMNLQHQVLLGRIPGSLEEAFLCNLFPEEFSTLSLLKHFI